jgi:LuxR family maltose regulon positive regulatory protein
MPRVPLHELLWSSDHSLYEFYTQGQLEQRFRPAEEAAWLARLHEIPSFAFHGASGSLNVYLEERPRGGPYWYAYHTDRGGTHKRYLGRTARVSLARLEAVAQALSIANENTLSSASPSFWHASPKTAQTLMLPSAKLAAPRLPSSLVERERLQSVLDGALSKPLTLLAASAGWGKTTLLATWASLHQEQVAWLSLDPLDNDPFRFWAAVIAALRTRVPGVGALALAMLHAPQPPPFSAVLTTLLNDLAEHVAPLVLLLDDYQVIDEPVIQEGVTFWVEHLPAHIHLLLSSRVDPDLPLPRWRARGQLLEIRTDEIRFQPEEASRFLGQTMGLALAEAEVAALQRRTEGWVAGLQLAALSLRTQPDSSAWIATFGGSHRYVLDYVQQEILGQQPESIQRFLVQVAVLIRMNAAICQAVTGEPASQELLETLERSQLFVVPLDEHRQWYRLHDLFREALLAQVQTREPGLLLHVHVRAARWYERQGELREAIVHALAATDYQYAAHLLERAAPSLWLSGEAQSVLTWVAALPDAVLSSHARLALDAARHLAESMLLTVRTSYVQSFSLTEQMLGRLETLGQRQGNPTQRSEAAEPVPALPDAEVALVHRRLRLLRALIAARAIMLRYDAQGMRHLVEEVEGLDEQEVSWKMISLYLTYELTETFQREGAFLIPRLLEAKREALEAKDHLATVRVMLWLAMAYQIAGRLRLVEQECLQALALAKRIGLHAAFEGYLHFCLALVYYAWNRLEEAAVCAHQVLHIGEAWQQADVLVSGHLALAQIDLARGTLPAADQALQQAEALFQQEQYATYATWVVPRRVPYWLAVGDLEAARHWAEQLEFSPQTWDPIHQTALLMQVRVLLAQRQSLQALDLLERWSRQLDHPGDIENSITFLALHLVTLHQAEKREQARLVAARLLALTEPEGNIRVYLDEGRPMKQALQSLLTTDPSPQEGTAALSHSFVSRLLTAFEHEEKGASRPLVVTPTPSLSPVLAQLASPVSPAPLEPLTRREQEVLRLLSEGASNQQIADALVISLDTVKKHVSNLLGKLGASSRTQAIREARARSLL